MTLKTICQDAAAEIGLQQPSTIINNTDPEAVKLLRYAQKTGKDLMKKHAWQNLRKEDTFTATTGSEQSGVLDSDFDRFVEETFWDRTNDRLIVGPVTAQEWQGLKAETDPGFIDKFIYRGNSIFFHGNASGSESMAFEFVSKNFCEDSGGGEQATWQDDTDVGRIDEELFTLGVIYQYLKGDGLPSAAAYAEYESYCEQLIKNDQPKARILTAGDIFQARRRFTGEPGSSSFSNINSGWY